MTPPVVCQVVGCQATGVIVVQTEHGYMRIETWLCMPHHEEWTRHHPGEVAGGNVRTGPRRDHVVATLLDTIHRLAES